MTEAERPLRYGVDYHLGDFVPPDWPGAALTEFLLARIEEDEAPAREKVSEDEECWRIITRRPNKRVLAECEAKRRFVAWFDREDAEHHPRDGIHLGLQILATIYADHPDFREEWRG